MTITAKQVQKLRQATGVSMMACKKALIEAEGNSEKAIEILRKKGEAKAATKSDRSTSEGLIKIIIKNGNAAVVVLKCETDFVARNEQFIEITNIVANKALTEGIEVAKTEGAVLVKDLFTKLGENMVLDEVQVIEGGVIGSYVHSTNKLASVVVLDGGDQALANDLAMQVTAMNPFVITPEEVDDKLIAKEKDIWAEQLKNEGKPETILDKIMMGKEKKFREESALVKQAFVKNPEQSIEQLLNGVKVDRFIRFVI